MMSWTFMSRRWWCCFFKNAFFCYFPGILWFQGVSYFKKCFYNISLLSPPSPPLSHWLPGSEWFHHWWEGWVDAGQLLQPCQTNQGLTAPGVSLMLVIFLIDWHDCLNFPFFLFMRLSWLWLSKGHAQNSLHFFLPLSISNIHYHHLTLPLASISGSDENLGNENQDGSGSSSTPASIWALTPFTWWSIALVFHGWPCFAVDFEG